MINIEVQPPTQTQAGTVMYPPVVVSSENDAAYDFVQVTLLDIYGQVIDDQLYGTLSTSPQGLNDRSARRSTSAPLEYSVFPDLVLGYPGYYTLRINAIRMDYSSPDGPVAVIVASAMTREIYVCDQSVATEVPSNEEKALLSTLRHSRGFSVPRAPNQR
ncbi:hypothetical protein F4809DRAFT_159578 [Biscogniauxia mediterranea]|nr:hypothetical protein F4809DRAFT_159578 [Biscogniauxia mediterranea]